METTYVPHRDEAGAVIGFYVLVVDISERKKAAHALEQRERQLRLVADNAPALIAYCDREYRYTFANRTAEQWYSRPVSEIVGLDASALVGEEAFRKLLPYADRALAGERVTFEGTRVFPDGVERSYLTTYVPDVADDGEIKGMYLLVTDISDRKEAERLVVRQVQKLEELTRTDPLTGVANRRLFMERAAKEVGRAQRYRRSLSVVMMDLDFFKAINDTHGHAAGDQVLTTFASFCRPYLRSDSDVFARLGGEEFALLLPETDAAGARVFAERICKAVAGLSINVGPAALTFACSFGVAQWSPGEVEIDYTLGRADEALHTAKAAGRNRVVAHDDPAAPEAGKRPAVGRI